MGFQPVVQKSGEWWYPLPDGLEAHRTRLLHGGQQPKLFGRQRGDFFNLRRR